MPIATYTPTLAAITDLIPLLIIVAISVGGWIMREAKKADAKRIERQRKERQDLQAMGIPMQGDAGDDRISTGPPSAEELAQRRRRELEALAKRRQGGGARPMSAAPRPASGAGGPTLEELRQRAQAKIEYERRAAALRQMAQNRPPMQASVSPARMPPRPVARPVMRPTALPIPARQSQSARPHAFQAARRPTPVAAAPPTSRSAPAGRIAPVAQADAVMESAQLSVPKSAQAESYVEAASMHTHRADAVVAQLAGRTLVITPQSLRDAIVLRELLGPPVGLRAIQQSAEPTWV